MKVELIDWAGGDISVVNSARISFNKMVEEIGSKDEKLINYLAEHKHMTPFRHNFIQLRCKVPLFLARQLMKHQSGLTWNEESRRYVDDPPEFYSPKEWRSRPEGSVKQGSGGGVIDEVSEEDEYGYYEWSVKEGYTNLVSAAITVYELMLKHNVAPEMARMVLPQSMMVNFIWSGNLLAFSHVYNLRSGEGAQQEAREFASLLAEQIEPKFPIAWRALTDV